MKNNTLLLIGLGVGAYFLLRKNKPWLIGANCLSSYGPKLDYVDKDGKCVLKKDIEGGSCMSSFGPGYERYCSTPHNCSCVPTIPRSQEDCPIGTKLSLNIGAPYSCEPILTEETVQPMSIDDCPVLPPNPLTASDCPTGTKFIDTSLANYIGGNPPSYCQYQGKCSCYGEQGFMNPTRGQGWIGRETCINRFTSCKEKKNCPSGSLCVGCTPPSGIQRPSEWCCRTPAEIQAKRDMMNDPNYMPPTKCTSKPNANDVRYE